MRGAPPDLFLTQFGILQTGAPPLTLASSIRLRDPTVCQRDEKASLPWGGHPIVSEHDSFHRPADGKRVTPGGKHGV